MRGYSLLISVGLLLTSLTSTAEVLEFEGYFPTPTASTVAIGFERDFQMSKQKGASKFECSLTGFSVEEEKAFNYVLSLWAEALNIQRPIKIYADFNGANTVAYNVQTIFIPYKGIAYPSSLTKQWSMSLGDEPCDMKISFCKDRTKWDFSIDASSVLPDGKYDFVTQALRAIARGLGFGSSLSGSKESTLSFMVNPPLKYVYDTKVMNLYDECLADMPIKSSWLKDFIHMDAYIDMGEKYEEYQVYTPEIYRKNFTCSYFNPDSDIDMEKVLMYPDVSGRIHYIGEKVKDVMYGIGWNKDCFSIVTPDIDNSNTVCLDLKYNPGYEFFICGAIPDRLTWEFSIPKKDGGNEIISKCSDNIFTVVLPPLNNTAYEMSKNGDVRAAVKATGTVNGKTETVSREFIISQRPPLPRAWITGCRFYDNQYFITFEFDSYGAVGYRIDIENNTTGHTMNGPYVSCRDSSLTKVEIGNFSNKCDYVLHVIARNGYGESEEALFNLFNSGFSFATGPSIPIPLVHGMPVESAIEDCESNPIAISIDGVKLSCDEIPIIEYSDRCEFSLSDKDFEEQDGEWRFVTRQLVNGDIKEFVYANSMSSSFEFSFEELKNTVGLPKLHSGYSQWLFANQSEIQAVVRYGHYERTVYFKLAPEPPIVTRAVRHYIENAEDDDYRLDLTLYWQPADYGMPATSFSYRTYDDEAVIRIPCTLSENPINTLIHNDDNAYVEFFASNEYGSGKSSPLKLSEMEIGEPNRVPTDLCDIINDKKWEISYDSDNVVLKCVSDEKFPVEVSFFSISGVLLKNMVIDELQYPIITIEWSDLPSGIYLMIVGNSDNKSIYKLIKH